MNPLQGRVDDGVFVEVFGFLACLGPGAFTRERAGALLAARPEAERQALVQALVEPSWRGTTSAHLASLLAGRAARRSAETGRMLAGLFPGLLAVDTDLGFSVLLDLAGAVGPDAAHDLSEVLLSLAFAESRQLTRSRKNGNPHNDADWRLERLRYLLAVLSVLDLDATVRARLFLALAQSVEDPEVRHHLVQTPLFPGTALECASVLESGNDDALRAVLLGAGLRPDGKVELYAACRALTSGGAGRALPVLGRLYHLILTEAPNARDAASVVRSSVLVALEAASTSRAGIAPVLPHAADLGTLHLLAVVAPGIPETARWTLCEHLVREAAELLKERRLPEDGCDAFVQVVVGATVLHRDPEAMSAHVRRLVLDVAGALHVRLQAPAGPSPADLTALRLYLKVVDAIAAEFRRRTALTGALAAVLPFVAALQQPGRAVQLPYDLW